MRVLQIDRSNPEIRILQEALDVLRAGGVVAAPTDTCYGLCADIFQKSAVEKVFAIKQRYYRKPISIIVKDLEMLSSIAYVDDKTRELAQKYLPGPLTIVVKRIEGINLTGLEEATVGFRMPNCKISAELVNMLNKPITTTSANVASLQAAYSAEEVIRQFEDYTFQPDLVLDGGELVKDTISTVVEVLDGNLRVLRQGALIIE